MQQPDAIIVDRRQAARIAVAHPVSIVVDGAIRGGATIDLSRTGLLATVPDGLTLWSQVIVALPEVGDRPARVVRRDDDRFGLLFREPLDPADFAVLAGTDPIGDVAEAETDAAPAARTAPWAFGRDRIKSFRRRAEEFAAPPRRR